jgi:hypothetical protein
VLFFAFFACPVKSSPFHWGAFAVHDSLLSTAFDLQSILQYRVIRTTIR